MKHDSKLLIISVLLLTGLSANGEELTVKSTQDQLSQPMPKNTGMTMSQIESRLGEPVQKIAAVGEPPITRWQYDNYTVYFEGDRAIHTVEHSN